MIPEIYNPESWSSFFMMVGGGVAALTGLIFVALTLQLEDMTKDATHKYRSINTLTGLTGVFVRCGLVLMPGQNHQAIGLEWLLVALVGAIIFVYGFHQAYKFGSHPSRLRLVIGACLYAAEIIGALLLVSGSIAGLYIAAVAMLVNVAFMTSAAWLLVASIYSAKRS